MSGAMGGSDTTTQKTQIPKYVEDTSKKALEMAAKTNNMGFIPYQGPTVAAFSPTQIAAMQNRNQGSNAFGMNTAPVMAGMPKPQQFAGGVMGYSGMPLYKESMAAWKKSAPGQYKAFMGNFMNPKTGKGGAYTDLIKLIKGEETSGGGGGGAANKSKNPYGTDAPYKNPEWIDRNMVPRY